MGVFISKCQRTGIQCFLHLWHFDPGKNFFSLNSQPLTHFTPMFPKSFCVCFIVVFLCVATSYGAAPPEKLRALIVDGQNNHPWAEVTPVLKAILEKSGRFTADVATSPKQGGDMSSFKPDFAKYDVVVMNYTGDDWPVETQQAFEKFVAEGGGLTIVHAACTAFPNWKEYNLMTGLGGWNGRNEKSGPYVYWEDGKVIQRTGPGTGGYHGPEWEFLIEVRDEEHPITKGLPKAFRHCSDELYDRLRGPAENLTILATAYADPEKKGTGRHEPQLMVIDYGKGRVFHITTGHTEQQCKSVSFIVPFERGTEWAATGKVTLPVPDDMPGVDKPVFREF